MVGQGEDSVSEQLTGRALDKEIAEALGKRLSPPIVEGGEWYGYGEGRWTNAIEPLTPFHADANAVIAVCAERGWYLSFTGNTALIAYPIGGDFARTHRGDGATPQEAAARALLAALTASA